MPTPPRTNIAEIAELAAKGVSVERLSVRFDRSCGSIKKTAMEYGFKVYTARQLLKQSMKDAKSQPVPLEQR